MSLGLSSGRVRLARAHDAWAAAFEKEKARIVAILGDRIVALEHVGSTAIPPVPAKPILDMLAGVRDFESARPCVGPMLTLGYSYRGEHGIPGRHYFVRGTPRTHHLHMLEVRSRQFQSTLKFRDLLRMHAELAGQFAREKERLAALYCRDRESYQREKGRVVEKILSNAERDRW